MKEELDLIQMSEDLNIFKNWLLSNGGDPELKNLVKKLSFELKDFCRSNMTRKIEYDSPEGGMGQETLNRMKVYDGKTLKDFNLGRQSEQSE